MASNPTDIERLCSPAVWTRCTVPTEIVCARSAGKRSCGYTHERAVDLGGVRVRWVSVVFGASACPALHVTSETGLGKGLQAESGSDGCCPRSSPFA